MAKAIWQGAVLAQSEDYETVEGNVYFPPQAVNMSYLRPSDTHTVCPWKGTARYYDVVVGEKVNRDAAWSYPEPKPVAKNITSHVAFWKDIEVEK